LIAACSPSKNNGKTTTATPIPVATADFTKLKPSCFIQDPANPLITMGSFFAGSNWNDPHVIKVGSQFVMYTSADINFAKNIKIYRLISSDGKNWLLSPSTAVFEKSTNPMAWDSQSTETPAVVIRITEISIFINKNHL